MRNRTPSGASTEKLVERLIRTLPDHDSRRALLAARLAALDPVS
jgi:hypothetical protein